MRTSCDATLSTSNADSDRPREKRQRRAVDDQTGDVRQRTCPECGGATAKADEWFAYAEEVSDSMVTLPWRCESCGHRWRSERMTRAEARRIFDAL
jgi:DNA-directed RNA polymerase subunit M/transcription elongation factor TFIIS